MSTNHSDNISATSGETIITADEGLKVARRVTWVGFAWNAILATAKIIGGIAGHSGAVIADGVHSLSDFITDVIVLVMVTISHRKSNHRYEYGHGKYETFASMIIAVLLVIVGIGILTDGLDKVILTIHGEELPRPGIIALVMCVASIVVKEWLYRYTRREGERIHSGALVANAWHHRSDSFSSIATLVGVVGAIWLGPQYHVLDPIAAMVVAVFIIIVGVKMAIPAVKELLEEALPADMQNEIRHIIAETQGVDTYHHLRTRRNGSTIIIDVHLKVNPELTVSSAHDISTNVERKLRTQFGNSTIVTSHIEPYRKEPLFPDGSCAD
jgi:cation diffusion facilitator family transporter